MLISRESTAPGCTPLVASQWSTTRKLRSNAWSTSMAPGALIVILGDEFAGTSTGNDLQI